MGSGHPNRVLSMNSDTAHHDNELVAMTYFDKLRAASWRATHSFALAWIPIPKSHEEDLRGSRLLSHSIMPPSDVACCYKPNAAFWEQYGPQGWKD